MTPFCGPRLHPDGGIDSLVERGTGNSSLRRGVRSGFFAGTIDGMDFGSKGQWLLLRVPDRAPAMTAREDAFTGTIPYTFAMTFHADTPRLDGRVKFRFAGQKPGRVSTNQRDGVSGFVQEEKRRFKLCHAVGEPAVGVRDLPFAIAETSNRCVQGVYWADLADGRTGLAVFSRGTMGTVCEAGGGYAVRLAFAMYHIWNTRMLDGNFTSEFVLYPFSGHWRRHDLRRRALEYNFPVVSVSIGPGTSPLGPEFSPFDIGSNNVNVSALYPEAGGLLARCCKYQGCPGEQRFALVRMPARLETVDLSGGNARAAASPLKFNAWRFQTMCVVEDRKGMCQ